MAQTSPFTQLTRDVAVQIFTGYLQPEEVFCGPARVCKSWRSICGSDDLWRAFACARWKDPMLPGELTWRELYMSIPRWWYRFNVKKDKKVWSDMYAMGKVVLCDPYLRAEAELVTREIMRRIRYNLEKIRDALEELEYPSVDLDIPTEEKAAEIREEFDRVEALTGQPLPLAFRLYYEMVGGVNLIGDWRILEAWWAKRGATKDEIPDYRPGELQGEMKYWLKEPWGRYYSVGMFGCDAAKAGTSASYYSMPLVPRSDAPIPGLGEPDEIKFVEYLSEAVSHGGLTGFCRNLARKLPRGVQKVYDRVRRDLLPVGVQYEATDHELISETIERDKTGREYRLQTLRVKAQEDLKSDDEAYQQWAKRYKRCRPAVCADVFEAAAEKGRRRFHFPRGESVLMRRVPMEAAQSKTEEEVPASKTAKRTKKRAK